MLDVNAPSPALSALFGGVYLARRVLLTGHTGFKGSWLSIWLRAMGARVFGLSLPNDDPASHHQAWARFSGRSGADPDEALLDIRDGAAVRAAMIRFEPEVVFHLAAQALVRPSYDDAPATWSTNVIGLVNVLEAVRQAPTVKVVVNVTSDKCYDNRETGRNYVETDALGGHDPYSASKACAEIVSASYRSSFLRGRAGGAVALATARAGNVIGGGDWSADRLIPDIVRSAMAGRAVRIRNPHAVRPWQHVLEPLAGYLRLGQCLLAQPEAHARAWNFGPDEAGHVPVADLVERFARHWPAVRRIADPGPHPHEAQQLHLDCALARQQLGWRPVWDAATMVERTAHWYRHWAASGQPCSADDLSRYVADARAAGLAWAT